MAAGTQADTPPPNSPAAKEEAERLNAMPPLPPLPAGHIDQTGRAQQGKASFYAPSFSNKPMADGRPMDPQSNVAASKNLPLGTTAKVTNLENGKTATVKVEDRGPYVDGRVVDLSPKVAEDLGMKHQGVAPVVVKPIAVPQPDGGVKLGAGAAEATPHEVAMATETTKALAPSAAKEPVAAPPDQMSER